ncbi:homocysteine S-methyltransferase family protein [Acerihabitans sp. TG2]|uniref:homocysteine S-methyltransferase family protein n=1 Tax=Acerihabitans sp. TG2 TaxID=3096008 RepID=UPI002B233A95|nr:homocysteine S-methyltransferase family protein [Acerihabitans sp. TG2]MEA9391957.1 homocysteine S-methyltransferase family protein [Acerihabitans sp. TG2]
MTKQIQILDGGMGRELARNGAPFRQPEWSALALIEAPQYVRQAHDAFIHAGAQVITANSYAVVPFHIGEARFQADGAALAWLAGSLARAAADASPHPVCVAGSLPPALGSYRPDLFEPVAAGAILQVLIDALRDSVDIWLAETQSAIAEVRLVAELLKGDRRPLWFSFTLNDALDEQGHARLRSGERICDAVTAATELNAAAVLFNCSPPEVMSAALREAAANCTLPLGVYANAFEPADNKRGANVGISELRTDTQPPNYLRWAQEWVGQGASIVGGCCGIGPEHIAALAAAFPPAGSLHHPLGVSHD